MYNIYLFIAYSSEEDDLPIVCSENIIDLSKYNDLVYSGDKKLVQYLAGIDFNNKIPTHGFIKDFPEVANSTLLDFARDRYGKNLKGMQLFGYVYLDDIMNDFNINDMPFYGISNNVIYYCDNLYRFTNKKIGLIFFIDY